MILQYLCCFQMAFFVCLVHVYLFVCFHDDFFFVACVSSVILSGSWTQQKLNKPLVGDFLDLFSWDLQLCTIWFLGVAPFVSWPLHRTFFSKRFHLLCRNELMNHFLPHSLCKLQEQAGSPSGVSGSRDQMKQQQLEIGSSLSTPGSNYYPPSVLRNEAGTVLFSGRNKALWSLAGPVSDPSSSCCVLWDLWRVS